MKFLDEGFQMLEPN